MGPVAGGSRFRLDLVNGAVHRAFDIGRGSALFAFPYQHSFKAGNDRIHRVVRIYLRPVLGPNGAVDVDDFFAVRAPLQDLIKKRSLPLPFENHINQRRQQ